MPFPRFQFRVRRRQRHKRVRQDRQTQHPGGHEAVVLRLGAGEVGVDEVGAASDEDQWWDGYFTDGAHGLPLGQERLAGGALKVGGDVHVGGEEEAACC